MSLFIIPSQRVFGKSFAKPLAKAFRRTSNDQWLSLPFWNLVGNTALYWTYNTPATFIYLNIGIRIEWYCEIWLSKPYSTYYKYKIPLWTRQLILDIQINVGKVRFCWYVIEVWEMYFLYFSVTNISINLMHSTIYIIKLNHFSWTTIEIGGGLLRESIMCAYFSRNAIATHRSLANDANDGHCQERTFLPRTVIPNLHPLKMLQFSS